MDLAIGTHIAWTAEPAAHFAATSDSSIVLPHTRQGSFLTKWGCLTLLLVVALQRSKKPVVDTGVTNSVSTDLVTHIVARLLP